MRFSLCPTDGRWDLDSLAVEGPIIRSAPLGFSWQERGRPRYWHAELSNARVEGPSLRESPHGSLQTLTIVKYIQEDQLELELRFALGLSKPLFLWQVRVTNGASTPIALQRVNLLNLRIGSAKELSIVPTQGATKARVRHDPRLGSLMLHPDQGDLGFYTTGWQSWTFAGVLGANDRFPQTRLGPLTRPILVNTSVPTVHRRGHFTSDMYGILGDRRSRKGLLLGFLSQRQAFGSLETCLTGSNPYLSMWASGDGVCLNPGVSFHTDWACIQFLDLEQIEPYEAYLEAVASENEARQAKQVPVGWCSWYTFFQSITQEDVIANLQWMKQKRNWLPLELVQIDDGFQVEAGDWDSADPVKFSSGMKSIGDKIHEEGFKAGIWLAPFLAKPGAQLLRDHPEWILRSSRLMPANAGFALNSFSRALDVTHPGFLEFLGDLMGTITQDWGYDYLKLDFLYAGALPGKRYDSSLSRAQGLYRALKSIRESVGDEITLAGCGCPLGSGLGIFDTMRVGPDVAPHWKPKVWGIRWILEKEVGLPSIRNALQSTVSRLSLHQRWWLNDPDCLLLREEDTELTEDEVQLLVTVVALSGGSMIVSDHLPILSAERAEMLAKLLPPLPNAAQALDWFDSSFPSRLFLPLQSDMEQWLLLALLNWADVPQTLSIDLERCGLHGNNQHHVFDVWQAAYSKISGKKVTWGPIPPHGVKLLAVRPIENDPQWVGDTLHISQGLVIKDWKMGSKTLQLKLDIDRQVRGRAWLAFPSEPKRIQLDGVDLLWEPIADRIYAIDLMFDRQARLDATWG